MVETITLRPFVPAKDIERSRAFYRALGFAALHEDEDVTVFARGGASFILQNFYVEAFAENAMHQLLVDDVDGWWRDVGPEAIAVTFGIKQPSPPVVQPWGMKVGFVWDPSGVLWHVTERPA